MRELAVAVQNENEKVSIIETINSINNAGFKYGEIGLNRIRKIIEYAKELNIKVAFENTKIKGYLEQKMMTMILEKSFLKYGRRLVPEK